MNFINKYALIFDSIEGRVAKLAEALKQMNFKLVIASEPEKLINTINRSNQISAVLVCADYCIENNYGTKIIEQINDANPRLTTIWFDGKKKKKTKFENAKPKVMIEYLDSKNLMIQALSKKVLGHIYPQDRLNSFTDGCEKFLRRSFKMYASPRTPFLRSSNKLFCNTFSMTFVQGDHLNGQIIVSTPYRFASDLYKRVSGLQEVSRNKVWDLMSEICNLVVGNFKSCFTDGISCRISIPTTFYSKKMEIIPKYCQPSLVIPFDEGPNTVFVEFNLDTFDPEESLKSRDNLEAASEDGDVCFL